MAVILVVDDNQKIRRLIDIYLRREGFSTLLAETGEQALHLLGEQAVDLMIVDIMMPGMDGYALVRQLRENRMEIPVLMATAKTEFVDKKEGFEAGADDYMTKPVDLEELVLRVRALLRRSRIYSENQIRIGEVTLDYNTLEVRLPGETVVLPQKEFYLLYKLFSYPNRIFTRQELMDEIWGFDSETSPRTVDVHIKRLRERFEQIPDMEISTIRGLGYKGVQKGT
ncbi:response regulator transcription factor [Anaerotruncus sp. 1XD42-93]|uniref:response regulator transcription factor n=1 Tax=Anaerotruncus sp. 1XD42-93 TaxID=2320853 RepID=UPI000EA18560|nr:response regulator transcription factor [Anaerotruncus sp. 1XD42-93]NBK17996.1 DNA-binding response regulator [Anaerotruncus sp. 1XD42-93]RKJ93692.1 DNA-binding response regulator [Anaerotruncus sp. 1XD22-93]